MKYLMYLSIIPAAISMVFLFLEFSDMENMERSHKITIVEVDPENESNAFLLPGKIITGNKLFSLFAKPAYVESYDLADLHDANSKHDYILAEIAIGGSGAESIICFPSQFYIVSEESINNCEPFQTDKNRVILSDGQYHFDDHAADIWGDWAVHLSSSTVHVQHIIEEIEGRHIESDLGYINAAYNWVQENLVFSYDLQDHSPLPDIQQVLNQKNTDCKGFSAVLATLLKARGIDSQLVLVRTQRDSTATGDYLLNGFDHSIIYLPEFNMYLDPTLPDSIAGEFYVSEGHYDGYNTVTDETIDLLEHMRETFFLRQDARIHENNDELVFEISVESFGYPISSLDLSQLEARLDRYLEIYTNIPKQHIEIANYEYTEHATRQLSLEYSVATGTFIQYHDSDSLMPTFNGFEDVEQFDRCLEQRRVSISLENHSDTLYVPTNSDPYEDYFLVEPTPDGVVLTAPTDTADFTCDPAVEYGARRDALIFDLYSPMPR